MRRNINMSKFGERINIMKLTREKLIELSHGAVRVVEERGKISFCRFTEEQQLLYKNAGNQSFYLKTFTPAGVRLVFRTNSTSLLLKVNIPFVTTRSYFSIDVYVNGEMTGCVNNYADFDFSGDYTKISYPIGRFEKSFDLGDGIKNVTVFLPWSVPTEIEEISIDDGAFAEPVVRNKKMLVFGDSITQGYDALHPSNRYITKIADLLCAEEYSKAIGGEKFFPELAELKDSFKPDYILVSYGSNDWSRSDVETFKVKCKSFFENLAKSYPDTKIFAVTPLWRKDMSEEKKFGDFKMVDPLIRNAVKDIENISVIKGFDFVPKEEKYFADLKLHPNDEGFEYYAENLYKEIKEMI